MSPEAAVGSAVLKTLFLPGAGGSASCWKPVATQSQLDGVFFAWPGLGAEAPEPGINSVNDLTALVANEITEPVIIVAQSMGGFIAIKLALAFPNLVKCLVLAATSGGVPVADLGGSDWRTEYFAAFPKAAKWIADPVSDLSDQIPSIEAPTLLLWGDADPDQPRRGRRTAINAHSERPSLHLSGCRSRPRSNARRSCCRRGEAPPDGSFIGPANRSGPSAIHGLPDIGGLIADLKSALAALDDFAVVQVKA